MKEQLDEVCLWNLDLKHKPDKCRNCNVGVENVFCNDYQPVPVHYEKAKTGQERFIERYGENYLLLGVGA